MIKPGELVLLAFVELTVGSFLILVLALAL